jgi:hypothetical protein
MIGGVPVIEAIDSPAEECRLSAPCSFGDLWAPHGEEHDYPTNQSPIELQPALGPTGPTGSLTGAATFAGAGSFGAPTGPTGAA